MSSLTTNFGAQSFKTDVQIRWLIERDIPYALKIERNCFEDAWTRKDFFTHKEKRSCIGMIAETLQTLDDKEKSVALKKTRDELTNEYERAIRARNQSECNELFLRKKDIVYEINRLENQLVGYMFYELQAARLDILNFAVDPDYRRHGIGKQMILRLKDKLSQQRRHEITLDIRETNLDGQLFFRSQGFKARYVVRNQYEDTGEDAYIMHYRLDHDYTGDRPKTPHNRHFYTEAYGLPEYSFD